MLIEQVVKQYLDGVFTGEGSDEGVDVYLETPETLPASFIVFRLADRGKENQINAVTLEMMSYAPSKYEAALLDEKLRDAMDNIITLPDISCRFGGGNDSPDTSLKKYRYRCYYNLYY